MIRVSGGPRRRVSLMVLVCISLAGCSQSSTGSTATTQTTNATVNPVMTVNPLQGTPGTVVHIVVSACRSVGQLSPSIHTVFFHDSYDSSHVNAGHGLSFIPRVEVGPNKDKVATTFTVPASAALGEGSFVVLCGHQGSASATFNVT